MELEEMNLNFGFVIYCVIWGNNNYLIYWVVVRMK